MLYDVCALTRAHMAQNILLALLAALLFIQIDLCLNLYLNRSFEINENIISLKDML